MKKILTILILSMFLFSFISAEEKAVNIPDGMTFEEYQQKVIEMNTDGKFFAIATQSYWGKCEQTCANLIFKGDCNPCSSGEFASDNTYHPDSQSSTKFKLSASSYCNDLFKSYPYYNHQAFCKVPTVECSGGSAIGSNKCDGEDIYKCDSSGTWKYVTGCDYGCSGGSCDEQDCSPNDYQECSGNDVYNFDSCGNKGSVDTYCESGETCENSQCVKSCTEEYIGSPECNGNDIEQEYRLNDCSTDFRLVEECSSCSEGQCSDTCPTTKPKAGNWGNCVNSITERTDYKCMSGSWEEFTDSTSCDCTEDNQCESNEVCDNSVCKPLECSGEEIEGTHECLTNKTNVGLLFGLIFGSFFIFIILGVFGYFILRSPRKKKGRRR